MFYSLVSLLLVGSATAWLPHQHELAAFNQTARHEQLGKRFKPNLADGITKIRGVNFGGSSPIFLSLRQLTIAGWLVCEPWLQRNTWNNLLKCGDSLSEFD